jgi:hypothetical protein
VFLKNEAKTKNFFCSKTPFQISPAPFAFLCRIQTRVWLGQIQVYLSILFDRKCPLLRHNQEEREHLKKQYAVFF